MMQNRFQKLTLLTLTLVNAYPARVMIDTRKICAANR